MADCAARYEWGEEIGVAVILKEISNVVRRVTIEHSHSVNCFLKAAIWDLATPYSCPANLATFAHQQIAWYEPKPFELIGREIHLTDVRKIKVSPLDVLVAKVGS
jgi:hypothetical protein